MGHCGVWFNHKLKYTSETTLKLGSLPLVRVDRAVVCVGPCATIQISYYFNLDHLSVKGNF